jgi:hypothetical protein
MSYPEYVRNIAEASLFCHQRRYDAFLACRESVEVVRVWMAERCVDLSRVAVLSAKDNPALRTPGAIISALPWSVKRLFINEVEALLPAPQPSMEEVTAFLGRVTALATPRGIQVTAYHTQPGQPLTHLLFPIDKEGRLL